MSRRDAGAAARQGAARHARERLQASLGNSPPGLLQTDDGRGPFEYDGGTAGSGPETAAGASGCHPPPDPGTLASAGTGPALRWRVGLRVAVLIGIAAVLAGSWFWWQVSDGQPQVVSLSDVSSQESPRPPDGLTPGTAEGGLPPVSGTAAQPDGMLVVHVAGAVATPGVVELPSGSRTHEAIAAAGGSTAGADLDRLNLAAMLMDGQKVYVPRPGEALPSDPSATASAPEGGNTAGSGSAETGQDGKTNLNTAGIEELDALPKVGPVLAQRIIAWRQEHGPFKTVEELDAVDGVGPKMLESLLPLVSV